MIAFVLSLLILSFLQGSVVYFNLVFIAIICRSFVTPERSNFWLAFGFGLLLSILLGYPLGSLSIIYLVIVWLIQFARKAQVVSNWVVVLLSMFFLLGINQIFLNVLNGSSIINSLRWSALLTEVILVLPIYLLVRFWEERFITRKDIRLKVGK